jgi:hypothetical protein
MLRSGKLPGRLSANGVAMQLTIRLFLLGWLFLAVAWAQSDPLGPHNVDGHACFACHTPSSDASYPAMDKGDYFWREPNDTPEAVNKYVGITQDQPLFHSFMCLTCHDGLIARMGMISRRFDLKKLMARYEPELIPGDNGHPVHVPYAPNDGCAVATEDCNPDHWPSTIDASGKLTWTGDRFLQQLAQNYGSPARFYPTSKDGGEAMVECSTCHNPHSLLYARVKVGDETLVKPTEAFLRGWYQTSGSHADTVSKFCRSCHYGHAANAFNQKEY